MAEERSIHNPVTGEHYTSVTRGVDTGGAYVEGRGLTGQRGRPRLLQGGVIGTFYGEIAEFRTTPPVVQRILLPPFAALGRRCGYRPYYERHFLPGEIDAILDIWAAHRPWAGNQRPQA